MANASEIDLFTRSLGGGRRARIELYKKYLRDNPRAVSKAASYPDPTDFLHDCFTNLLRGGKTWNTDGTLASWTEKVVSWTAMERTRAADLKAQIEKGTVRLCAEVECDDARALEQYCPPSIVNADSPQAHIADLLDEFQSAVFKKRIEGADWEETARSLEKPLTAIGPAFCRALGRTSRLTGAPPPIEEDHDPVFTRSAKDPTVPEGRSVTIQLDPGFYTITPELGKIGINTSREARSVVLWEAAISADPPGAALQAHLDECHYCADLFHSFSLLHKLIAMTEGGLIFCPSAYSLATTPEKTRAVFDEHCAQCKLCAAERAAMLGGQALEPPAPAKPAKSKEEPSPQKRLALLAGALAALILIPTTAYFFVGKSRGTAERGSATTHSDVPTVMPDARFTKLIEDVKLDDEAQESVMRAALPENKSAVREALRQFSLGNFDVANAMIQPLAEKTNDPSAHLLYAMALNHTGLMNDAYREMLAAERIAPRDPLRCWIMLQFSLMVAELETTKREVGHLADTKYGPKAKKVWESIH